MKKTQIKMLMSGQRLGGGSKREQSYLFQLQDLASNARIEISLTPEQFLRAFWGYQETVTAECVGIDLIGQRRQIEHVKQDRLERYRANGWTVAGDPVEVQLGNPHNRNKTILVEKWVKPEDES